MTEGLLLGQAGSEHFLSSPPAHRQPPGQVLPFCTWVSAAEAVTCSQGCGGGLRGPTALHCWSRSPESDLGARGCKPHVPPAGEGCLPFTHPFVLSLVHSPVPCRHHFVQGLDLAWSEHQCMRWALLPTLREPSRLCVCVCVCVWCVCECICCVYRVCVWCVCECIWCVDDVCVVYIVWLPYVYGVCVVCAVFECVHGVYMWPQTIS